MNLRTGTCGPPLPVGNQFPTQGIFRLLCNRSRGENEDMTSRKRVGYTTAVVAISLMLSLIAPTVVPAVASLNSHSATVVCVTNCSGDTNGPGYMSFWTSNVTQALKEIVPPPGVGFGTLTIGENFTSGVSKTWTCGNPTGIVSQPVSNSSQPTLQTGPEPGQVLVVIDMGPYCQLTNVTNG
jgi:hypothetical protein